MNKHLPLLNKRDSAAARMTTRIPRVHPEETIRAVELMLHAKSKQFETITYIYVVDQKGALLGVLSLLDLYRQEEHALIGAVCVKENLISLPPEAHQERAAYLALKHNLKAIPVVHDGILLGAIPPDRILAIIYKETHEDLMRMAGAHHHVKELHIDHILKISPWQSLLHRLPWLIFGLFGGLVAARIIESFDAVLEKHLILASFIPLVVYMSSAIGTQMEAFIIRDLAIERSLRFGKYFMKQFSIVLAMGVLLGTLMSVIAVFGFSDIRLGAVLGVSLLVAIASSVITGLIIPYLLSRANFDPANASGPVATIIQDILSIFVYFTVASLLLA